MYLHLGRNTVVRSDEIVGIFDLETSTVSKNTRDFLKNAQKSGRVINVSYELPKSFVITKKQTEKDSGNVYISQLSTQTLKQRAEKVKSNF